jgi:hypothetical protein
MVLMRVIAAVGENDIRLDAAFELLEPGLDLGRLRRKEAVAEMMDLDAAAFGPIEEVGR